MPEKSRTIMPPCSAHEENLVLLHYGELAGAEGETLRAHIGGCRACAEYLKDLSAVLPLTVAAGEPAPGFWTDYDRELRNKIDLAAERRSWSRISADFFRPRWMTAFATAALLALGLTFTLERGVWGPQSDKLEEDVAILELMPVAEDLEFFSAMDVLDNLEVLESMESPGSAT